MKTGATTVEGLPWKRVPVASIGLKSTNALLFNVPAEVWDTADDSVVLSNIKVCKIHYL